MEIRFLEVDRLSIPLIVLLAAFALFGYLLARRWPATVWFVLAGVAGSALLLAQELTRVSSLDLHPLLRRTLAVEALVGLAITIIAIVMPLRAAIRTRRRRRADLRVSPRGT